jgi:hypothetical protein
MTDLLKSGAFSGGDIGRYVLEAFDRAWPRSRTMDSALHLRVFLACADSYLVVE